MTWLVVQSGVLVGAGGLQGQRLPESIAAIRASLFNFYKKWAADHRDGPTLTAVTDFTAKMLGSQSECKMKLKGAETFCYMHFLLHLLGLHKDRVAGGDGLWVSGQCMRDMLAIFERQKW